MRIKVRKSALKSLEKLNAKDKERIRLKIKHLVVPIEEQGVIRFREVDIKNLGGEAKSYFQDRWGKGGIIHIRNRF